jgi:hypothetical protein
MWAINITFMLQNVHICVSVIAMKKKIFCIVLIQKILPEIIINVRINQ